MPHVEPSLKDITPLAIPKANDRPPFIRLGEWFGYPACCIKWMYYLLSHQVKPSQEHLQREEEMGFVGTGYRICPECLREKTMKQIYDEVCNAREEPAPFPLESEELLRSGPTLATAYTRVYHPFHERLSAHVAQVEAAGVKP